jgi:chromosome segregation ATPase
MNLANILTRRDPLKRAFVTLEDGMSDVLNEKLIMPLNEVDDTPPIDMQDSLEPMEDQGSLALIEQPAVDQGDRVTAHTQGRLAGYSAFEEARARAQDDLNRIGEALASIMASQHMSRDFLDDCYADIHRANDLENGNAAYAAENRRLLDRVDKLERLRARYDQLVDVLKRREAKLLDEVETTRETIGSLRLDVVEARNTIVRCESMYGELQTIHAARTNEAERYMRESEMLREKNVGLSVELDLAQKKQAESRRRVEELSAMHASDSARLAEIMSRLVAEEADGTRLQKLNDALEAKLIEANENTTRLAAELTERDKRFQSENQALRSEMQTLNARLQVAANEQRDAVSDLTTLRSKMNDMEADRHVLEKRLVAANIELDNERRMQAQAAAEEVSDADQSRSQTEHMREQIAELQATVAQLKQYESLYTAAKSRKGKMEAANGFTPDGGKAGAELVQMKQAGRA